MTTTSEQVKAMSALLIAITEAINAVPEGIPSGHLYASLMGKMSLQVYEQIISALVACHKIRKQGHLLLPL